jgi:hypothetical protein
MIDFNHVNNLKEPPKPCTRPLHLGEATGAGNALLCHALLYRALLCPVKLCPLKSSCNMVPDKRALYKNARRASHGRREQGGAPG